MKQRMKGVQIRIAAAKITFAMAALSQILKLALRSITLVLSFPSEERLARKKDMLTAILHRLPPMMF